MLNCLKDGRGECDAAIRGRKFETLAERLRSGERITRKDAAAFSGGRYLQGRLRDGTLTTYEDENPDYHSGVRWSRPMRTFVKLGGNEFIRKKRGRPFGSKNREDAAIGRAIALLTKHGYVVEQGEAA